jgi:competence protein ComEA
MEHNRGISSWAGHARRALALVSMAAVMATVMVTWLWSPPARATEVRLLPAAAPLVDGRPDTVRVAAAAERERAADRAGDGDGDDDAGSGMKVRGKTLRGTVNINTATAEQLSMLPGIGPAKAQRIVESRSRQGPFQRTRDLRRVRGIGFKTFKKLEPYLAVKGDTTLTVE